jgi:ribonucleoside-triphosphate reductase (thioredoxin)
MNQPNWGPNGRQVYERTYRRTMENGQLEQWHDTVARVVDGNLGLVDPKHHEKDERNKLIELFYNFKALPAGRHLWMSGVPGRQFLFNCHHAGWDEADVTSHFSFTFDQLMQGGGVGANYSNEFVQRYEPVKHAVDVHIVCDPDHPDYYDLISMGVLSSEYSYEWGGATRVQDSREGWSEALATLLGAFWNGVEVLVMDVSLVRHKGAKIKTFGGTAAGPMPLAKLLTQTAKLLSDRVGEKIKSLDAMLIDHWIGECVVSGNVRRSARMSIKNWADPDIFDFINCKADSGEHWSTNISIEINDEFFKALKRGDKHARAVYRAAMTGMLTNGEPGFYNRSLAEVGEVNPVPSTNPCGEICLEEWENCNLGHVNLDFFYDDFEGAVEAHRLMTRYLIRATFGDVPNERQKEVLMRNRRIGVGHFGFHGWLVKQGIRFSDSHRDPYVRKTLRDFYNAVRKEARRYAFHLRVPEPIKVTTIAPTGTIAKLAGRSEGIHPILFKYYINRVRFSTVDPGQILQLEEFEKEGYDIEDDMYTPNTKVVSFIAKNGLLDEVAALGYDADYLVEAAADIPLADMLAVQAMYQEYYADNAVSFTVNVKPHESQIQHIQDQTEAGVPVWEIQMIAPPEKVIDESLKTLIHYLPSLKGTTLMVDGSRPQSPYESLTKEQYEMYNLVMVGDGLDENCMTGACPIK